MCKGDVDASQQTLELCELHVGEGIPDPSTPELAADLFDKLGVPIDSNIGPLKENHGGMNLGVWELKNTDVGVDIILKSVKAERSHPTVPTEKECFVEAHSRFPSLASEASLCFPIKIFTCIGPDGEREADLIAMHRAKGEQLCGIIGRKLHESRSAEVMDIIEQIGTSLGKLHTTYEGLQHGDFQPSNIFYDELTGEVTFIDLGRMSMKLLEDDLEHFSKSLEILSQTWGEELSRNGIRHLKAGYAKGTGVVLEEDAEVEESARSRGGSPSQVESGYVSPPEAVGMLHTRIARQRSSVSLTRTYTHPKALSRASSHLSLHSTSTATSPQVPASLLNDVAALPANIAALVTTPRLPARMSSSPARSSRSASQSHALGGGRTLTVPVATLPHVGDQAVAGGSRTPAVHSFDGVVSTTCQMASDGSQAMMQANGGSLALQSFVTPAATIGAGDWASRGAAIPCIRAPSENARKARERRPVAHMTVAAGMAQRRPPSRPQTTISRSAPKSQVQPVARAQRYVIPTVPASLSTSPPRPAPALAAVGPAVPPTAGRGGYPQKAVASQWSTLQSVRLCRTPQQLVRVAPGVPKLAGVTSVSDACRLLNTGTVQNIDAGLCVAFSQREGFYFLLYRQDAQELAEMTIRRVMAAS